MSISSVSNQVNALTQSLSSTSSDSSSGSVAATSVTSNDPAVLMQQEKTVQSEITQLQQSSGSSEKIQSLKQELQAIQQRLQEIGFSADTAVSASKASVLDVKA